MSQLTHRLREQIEEEIATGQLLPGTPLDEVELAQRFSVSRTPIREVLSLLAGEGLVDLRPRRGAVVTSLSPVRLIEMFELMAELEAMCAKQAARRLGQTDLEQIVARHQACAEAAQRGDSDEYFYANEQFHQALYAAAQNGFLREQALALQRRLRPYRRLQLRVRNRVQRSLHEHQVIVDAIKAGQTEAAQQAAREHVFVQGERFSDLMANLGAWSAESRS
ncbi:MAG: hypothetical protein RLZZ502_1155 [Pseudomonadota bacterium]|jgi:DNA-binding GntR family transcriptional regulator